jgi:hypothetical protein
MRLSKNYFGKNGAVSDRAFQLHLLQTLFSEPVHRCGFYQCCGREQTTAPEEENQAWVWKAVPMPKSLNKKWFGAWHVRTTSHVYYSF